jgi:apolipoprotein N-acyltransferase
MASLRAVEQGRYLARAANTGITGIVDPYGRVLARTGLFEAASLVGEVRFLTGQTLYARAGDLFAYACALAALAALAASRFVSSGALPRPGGRSDARAARS